MEHINILNEILKVSSRKKQNLENILGTLKLQSRFIELQKTDAILKQIDLREEYNKKVKKLDITFFTLFDKLKSNLGINSIDKIDTRKYPQVKDLKEIVEKIISIDDEIQVLERQVMFRMQNNMENISNKLKAIKQGNKVTNVYKKQKNIKKYIDSKENK